MGFMDELKKLTQPYEDDSDFFEGANETYRPAEKNNSAAANFEDTFGAQPAAAPQPAAPKKSRFKFSTRAAAPQPQPQQQDFSSYAQDIEEDSYADDPEASGGLFGNFSLRKQPRAPKVRGNAGTAGYANDSQMILYSPKSFEDARELVSYLRQGHSVVMTLEGMETDMARRLLDLCSGIALALDGKITQVSAKTYFVTPANVDIVGNAPEVENSGY